MKMENHAADQVPEESSSLLPGEQTKSLGKLRVKVAELSGWIQCDPATFNTFDLFHKKGVGFRLRKDFPDYLNDLNACAEFEKGLTEEQCERYRTILADPAVFLGNDYPAQQCLFHATAEQRCCRAFVAAMG